MCYRFKCANPKAIKTRINGRFANKFEFNGSNAFVATQESVTDEKDHFRLIQIFVYLISLCVCQSSSHDCFKIAFCSFQMRKCYDIKFE